MSEDREYLKERLWQDAAPFEEPNATWFPEIKGLCRTCKEAFIFQREHGERPEIICKALFEKPRRMPPDVMKCSEYRHRGDMSINTMADMAYLIDPRDTGGQYL